jgi:hypothetical protein
MSGDRAKQEKHCKEFLREELQPISGKYPVKNMGPF